jgi:hypothetical protein
MISRPSRALFDPAHHENNSPCLSPLRGRRFLGGASAVSVPVTGTDTARGTPAGRRRSS